MAGGYLLLGWLGFDRGIGCPKILRYTQLKVQLNFIFRNKAQ
jgi:hypothetical protein